MDQEKEKSAQLVDVEAKHVPANPKSSIPSQGSHDDQDPILVENLGRGKCDRTSYVPGKKYRYGDMVEKAARHMADINYARKMRDAKFAPDNNSII